MKIRKYVLIVLLMLSLPTVVVAQRGCCSHHGGVAGCNSSGRQICNDGTLSPTCTCAAPVNNVYGCTDKEAKNYNSSANKDNGSCIYYKYGCMDKDAINYDATADKSDSSCEYEEEEKDIVEPIEMPEVEEELPEETKEEETEEEESDGSVIPGLLVLGGGAYGINRLKKKKRSN